MRIIALVPVYNEGKTIGDILKILTTHKRIDKVIVINDGSTDDILRVLKRFDINVINLKKNHGKGGAIRIAAKNLKADIILMFDADLIGLNYNHIDVLLDTLIKRKAAMVIGLRDKGNFLADAIMPYFPLTGGERAILAPVFMNMIKNPLIEGWGMEYVMNDYCKKKRLKMETIKLDGLNHIGGQAKKYGWRAFIKEVYDVGLVKLKLFGVEYS